MDLFAESVSFELAQLDPSIIVKLIPIHGGVKSTNFRNSSNSSDVLARWQKEHENQSDEVKDMVKQYGAYAQKVFSVYAELSARSMEVEEPAGKIYEAASDGQTKLRYFESGDTGGDLLKARMRGGKEGEALDDIDGRYVDFLRGRFA